LSIGSNDQLLTSRINTNTAGGNPISTITTSCGTTTINCGITSGGNTYYANIHKVINTAGFARCVTATYTESVTGVSIVIAAYDGSVSLGNACNGKFLGRGETTQTQNTRQVTFTLDDKQTVYLVAATTGNAAPLSLYTLTLSFAAPPP
jgi:hypothetical protein